MATKSKIVKKSKLCPIDDLTDEKRKYDLKNLFGDMNPKAIANYSRAHPGDQDLNEYITRFASSEFNEELFRRIPYSIK